MQKITPFLWFDHEAEEAANFYVSLFNDAPGSSGSSKITAVTHYDSESANASGQPKGSVMTVAFQLAGEDFVAINGGSFFKFSGAISFIINCATQEEVDYFWDKLSSNGGEAGQCGWINHDKFRVTWQVVPIVLGQLLGDPEKSRRVMAAMLKMNKIIIADLEWASQG